MTDRRREIQERAEKATENDNGQYNPVDVD